MSNKKTDRQDIDQTKRDKLYTERYRMNNTTPTRHQGYM